MALKQLITKGICPIAIGLLRRHSVEEESGVWAGDPKRRGLVADKYNMFVFYLNVYNYFNYFEPDCFHKSLPSSFSFTGVPFTLPYLSVHLMPSKLFYQANYPQLIIFYQYSLLTSFIY